MSKVINNAVGHSIADLRSLAASIGAGYALNKVMDSFLELEETSARLKSVTLRDGGRISENFEKVNDLAIQLGNRLPGTTADIQNMFAAMIRGGVSEEAVLNGIGKAAAEFAIVTKLPFEEAATFASKMKMATGTSDKDMGKLMDVIQRTINLGVRADEMQFAFANSGGKLAAMGLQGVEASKGISLLYAALIRAGNSGERVGTNMTMVFDQMMNSDKMAEFNAELGKFGVHMDFFDKKGKFLGTENMVAQIAQLNKLNPIQRADAVRAWLGPGADARFVESFAKLGKEGYNSMMDEMLKQANIDERITILTDTLGAKWEAAMGNLTNMSAEFGQSLTDAFDLKGMSDNAAGFFATITKGLKDLNESDYFKNKTIPQMIWGAANFMDDNKNFQAGAASTLDGGAFVLSNAFIKRETRAEWKKGDHLFNNLAENFNRNALADSISKSREFVPRMGDFSPKFVPVEPGFAMAGGKAESTVAGVQITYSPNITMTGTASKEDIDKMLQNHSEEIMKTIEAEKAKQARKAF